ncbi:MAG: hypothetical protein R6V05_08330 [Candidatus Brocadiia bacterium]
MAEGAAWLDALESVVGEADPEETEQTITSKDAIETSGLMRKMLLVR